MDFDDLDDLIEDLIPKSKLKKLKKKAKSKSLLALLIAWIVRQFSGSSSKKDSDRRRDQEKRERRKSVSAEKPTSPSKRDPLLDSLVQATQYSNNIEAMAQAAKPGSVERMRLDALSERVADWVRTMEAIVNRALDQQEDTLLQAQRKQVPEAIKRLEKQLSQASDPQLQAKLARTLESRRKQLAQLKKATDSRLMTELKIENALAQLGIIYTQLHSGRAMAERGDYQRLSAEVGEEVHVLEDYLHALDELTGAENYA